MRPVFRRRFRRPSLARILLAAIVLSTMSLSGANVALNRLHARQVESSQAAPSTLIRSVATHAADSGDQ